MEANIELETNDLTKDELDKIHTLANTCNAQAFKYMEESDNDVVVKDSLIEGSGISHCYIHDRDRDVVIDACMGQFSVGPHVGAWDGETHPYAVEFEETREWESVDEFKAFYEDAPENDFIF